MKELPRFNLFWQRFGLKETYLFCCCCLIKYSILFFQFCRMFQITLWVFFVRVESLEEKLCRDCILCIAHEILQGGKQSEYALHALNGKDKKLTPCFLFAKEPGSYEGLLCCKSSISFYHFFLIRRRKSSRINTRKMWMGTCEGLLYGLLIFYSHCILLSLLS